MTRFTVFTMKTPEHTAPQTVCPINMPELIGDVKTSFTSNCTVTNTNAYPVYAAMSSQGADTLTREEDKLTMGKRYWRR